MAGCVVGEPGDVVGPSAVVSGTALAGRACRASPSVGRDGVEGADVPAPGAPVALDGDGASSPPPG
ncbi:hypothetical protein KDA82_37085, partial [Streptomyces daliensis]|nr:hypothetical protein [Streptomyces daliensis]